MTADTDMAAYWARISGPWLANEASMEAMLAPVGRVLAEALAARPGEAVLDIGPGSGASLLWLADAVAPGGRVTGVDLAPPMAARAAERVAARPEVNVVTADAGAAPVDEAAFDAVVSQFGMMFFVDPAAGFATVARNLRPGGRMVFAAWGPRSQNPLFAVPGQVAAQLFGPTDPQDPDAPGPFGLQSASRGVAMLTKAGLIEARADLVAVSLTPKESLADFAALQGEVGPAAGRLREVGADGAALARLFAAIVEGFAGYDTPDGLQIPAVVLIYSARRPG